MGLYGLRMDYFVGSVFEGLSKDWSGGGGAAWSQNGLVLKEVCWRVAAGTGQKGGKIGLKIDYFGGSVKESKQGLFRKGRLD